LLSFPNIKAMKNLVGSKSRLFLGIAILFTTFSISNSCTKTISDESGQGVTFEPYGNNNVSVSQGAFYPAEVTINLGDIITWTNTGYEAQSVTSDSGFFDGILSVYGTFSYRFLTPGTYSYHSRITPMTGKVIVK
jgi:plastocyanin